ncbi:unnamed protein product [Amoebophrya sp. A120]|nr:unnamed protein product [Amoebophrya sp. A120]|eukprot:GSA120T00004928001.1
MMTQTKRRRATTFARLQRAATRKYKQEQKAAEDSSDEDEDDEDDESSEENKPPSAKRRKVSAVVEKESKAKEASTAKKGGKTTTPRLDPQKSPVPKAKAKPTTGTSKAATPVVAAKDAKSVGKDTASKTGILKPKSEPSKGKKDRVFEENDESKKKISSPKRSPSVSPQVLKEKPKKPAPKQASAAPSVVASAPTSTAKKRKRSPQKITITEQMIEAERRWWLEPGAFELTEKKWNSLELMGFVFQPEYVPHNVPLLYEKKPIYLPPQAEEIATWWVSVIGSHYEKSKIFRKNFFADFTQTLAAEAKLVKAKFALPPAGSAANAANSSSSSTGTSNGHGKQAQSKETLHEAYWFPLPKEVEKSLLSKEGKAEYCSSLLTVKDLTKCDFSKIHNHVMHQREKMKAKNSKKKEATPMKKQKKKKKADSSKDEDENADLDAAAQAHLSGPLPKYCLLDKAREPVGNFQCEPPGLFRGRGQHPKQGIVKPRCMPKDVCLNLDLNAEPPKCSIPGHCWGDIYHDNTVSLLGSFLNKQKYIQVATSSAVKMQPDALKYEKARKLHKVIEKIRKDYMKKIQKTAGAEITSVKDFNHRLSTVREHFGYTGRNFSVEEQKHGSNPDAAVFVGCQKQTAFCDFQYAVKKGQQLGCAAYLIDKLALRVGNTKDEDEEADTVGCTTLRVEHVICQGKVVALKEEELSSSVLPSDQNQPLPNSDEKNNPRSSANALEVPYNPVEDIRQMSREHSKEDVQPSPLHGAEPVLRRSAAVRQSFDEKLLKEHLEYRLKFSFLGKDSVPYENEVLVPEEVYNCVQQLQQRKKKKDLLFDLIDSSDLNAYFKEFLPGLSAKVFRTYNASITLEQELGKFSWETLKQEFYRKHQAETAKFDQVIFNSTAKNKSKEDLAILNEKLEQLYEKQKPQLLVHFYNQANRAVAVLCNHQRNVAATHEGQMDVLQQKLDFLKEEIEFLKDHMREWKGCKSEAARKKLLKKSEQGLQDLHEQQNIANQEKISNGLNGGDNSTSPNKQGGTGTTSAAGKKKTQESPSREVSSPAVGAAAAGSSAKRNAKKKKETQEQQAEAAASTAQQVKFNLKSVPGKLESCKEKLLSLSQVLVRTEDLMKRREENKNVALGTSKINYMDPRITISFCKRVNLEVNKVFNKAILSKFPWAVDCDQDFEFQQ